ncbi:hypothetical protein DL238_03370 [Alteriqipengyuania lutimaris]|uniref:Uncharacterized protein n=1 Tax=Alteriqipengyuania lutimaris TaxID=1538146 RepID=A0A395LPV4_9SPHN|nr:hypothetical protein DL238_03370 [Alteriqipengyuania lutimaris]
MAAPDGDNWGVNWGIRGMMQQMPATEKQTWVEPTLTVVAMTSDVRSQIGPTVDEDFDGFPS